MVLDVVGVGCGWYWMRMVLDTPSTSIGGCWARVIARCWFRIYRFRSASARDTLLKKLKYGGRCENMAVTNTPHLAPLTAVCSSLLIADARLVQLLLVFQLRLKLPSVQSRRDDGRLRADSIDKSLIS